MNSLTSRLIVWLPSNWRVPAGLLFLLAASVLLTRVEHLSDEARAAGWLVLLTVAVLMSRAGLLRLAGPVFACDAIRTLRRSRLATLRTGYVSLLLLVLFAVYLQWFHLAPVEGLRRIMDDQAIEHNEQARFAEAFSATFLIAQFVVLIALTPAFTAGALVEELEKKTYEDLRMTDLTPLEIVVGKLASRVAYLLLLLLAGLPILALLQFLGGVDPALLLTFFVFTLLTVISTAAASLSWSMNAAHTRQAVVDAYFRVGALQLLLAIPSLMCWGISNLVQEPRFFGGAVSVSIAGTYPFLRDLAALGQLGQEMPLLLLQFLLVHGLMTAFYLWRSVQMLSMGPSRRLWRRVSFRPQQKRPPTVKASQLRAPQKRKRHTLDNTAPVLWKDLYSAPIDTPGLSPRGSNTLILIFGLVVQNPLLLFTLVSVLSFDGKDYSQGIAGTVPYLMPIFACGGMLVFALNGAETISKERQRQTLDDLLTTDLTTSEILKQKWQASLYPMWGMAIVLGILLLQAATAGAAAFVTFPLFALGYFAQACFAVNLGMYCSLICSSTQRATIATLCGLLGVGLGHWLIYLVVSVAFHGPGHNPILEQLRIFHTYGLTPPLSQMTLGTFGLGDAKDHQVAESHLLAACAGTLVYAGLAVWLWVSLHRRFRVMAGRAN